MKFVQLHRSRKEKMVKARVASSVGKPGDGSKSCSSADETGKRAESEIDDAACSLTG